MAAMGSLEPAWRLPLCAPKPEARNKSVACWNAWDCSEASMPREQIEAQIEALFGSSPTSYTEEHFRIFQSFKDGLNDGTACAAEPDAATPCGWAVNG